MLIVPTLHPAFLLKNGDDDGQAKFEQTVIADLQKGRRLTRAHPTWDESMLYERDGAGRLWRCFPAGYEVEWFFQRFYAACARHPEALQAGTLSLTLDVETTKDAPMLSQLICVGLGFRSPTEEQVINVPILCCGGSRYWAEPDEQRIRWMLASVMADTRVPVTCHNKGFDTAVMWSNGMRVVGHVWDTMAAHHVADAELPHNLGFVGSLYTDGRYWKDDSKGDGGFLAIPDETLRLYNLRDILVTQRVQEVLHGLVKRHNLWNLYLEQLRGIDVMTRASLRGMLIDERKRTSRDQTPEGKFVGLQPQLEKQRDDAIDMLRQVSGNPTFDPARPAFVSKLFFEDLKFPVVLTSPKTGKPKVDKEAMMLLEMVATTREQRTALRGVIEFRQAEKFLGTFIHGLGKFVHPGTWRFHTQWKLLAVSGRWTSSPNCFDAETEVLTRAGWVKLPDLESGVEVAQWHPDGRVDFVLPELVQAVSATPLLTFKNQHIDLAMTRDHRALLRHRKTGALRVFRADEYPEDWQQLHSGNYAGPGLPLTDDELRLLVAIQADAVTEPFTRGWLTVRLTRTRKVERMEALLTRLDLPFTKAEEHNLPDRAYRATFKVKHPLIEKLREYLGDEKRFGPWLLNLSRRQLDVFIEELWYWDGSFTRKNNYSSSTPGNAAWVQTVLHLSGVRGHMREVRSTSRRTNWQVDMTPRDYSLTTNIERGTLGEAGTTVYCVTVPSSYVMVRRNGRITVTGNCQNWNKKVKSMFRAAPGWKFVGVDLSQAELRFMAYLANDQALLAMYTNNINVHTVNTCLLFKVQCPNPKDMNPATEQFVRSEMQRVHGITYDSCPVPPASSWKTIRTLGKSYVFAANYGAEAETMHRNMRSKRDPDSNKLLFPTLLLSEIQALAVMWTKKLHPEIPQFWEDVQLQTRKAGGYFCPISGRVRWFRGGFKRNEMLNIGLQMGVASWMNKCMVEIQDIYDAETGGAAQVVQQVHDALNVECPEPYAKRAGEVMNQILNREFPLLGHKATLPADPALIGDYLDEV